MEVLAGVVDESGAAGFVPATLSVQNGGGVAVAAVVATGEAVAVGDAEERDATDGMEVGLGVGVGQGFSREVHSCHGAESLPPNSFQRAWQRSDQCW